MQFRLHTRTKGDTALGNPQSSVVGEYRFPKPLALNGVIEHFGFFFCGCGGDVGMWLGLNVLGFGGYVFGFKVIAQR